MSMVVTLAQAKRSGAVFDSSAAMAKRKDSLDVHYKDGETTMADS